MALKANTYYSCSNFRNKGSKVCSANSVRAMSLKNMLWTKYLKLSKVIKFSNKLSNVSIKKSIDMAALNHDIAYNNNNLMKLNTKLKNLIQTIENNPDLTSALKPTIHQYETQLNDITNKLINSSTNKIKRNHL